MTRTWSSPDGSVRKEIRTEGSYSKKPAERSICGIRVDNIEGSEFCGEDLKLSGYVDGTPDKIIVIGDAGSKIDRAVERVVRTMFINEQSLVRIALPRGGDSPDACLRFEVTLTSHEPYKPIWEWKPSEKYEIALKYKEKGVELFKSSRFVDAFLVFGKACKILITLEPVDELRSEESLYKSICELRIILYNNMAGCQLNEENFEHVVTLCDKVLAKSESNVKALYRKAVACGKLKDFEGAIANMEKVLSLKPNDSGVREKLASFKKSANEADRTYDDIVRNMFKAYE